MTRRGWDTIIQRAGDDGPIAWMAVVPVGDLRFHRPDDPHCSCGVEVHDEPTADERLVPFYVHMAFDGRELVDRHGLQ